MKRFFKIVTAAALIASGFLFGSCEDEEVVNVLQGPANTWCRMPVDYKNDGSSDTVAKLYAHFYYTETETTIGKETLPAGLSIVITAFDESTSSIITGLTENAYIIKKFPKDESTTIGDDTNDTASITFNGSRTKWTAIYWGKDELHKKENQTTTAPTQLNGTGIEWENIKDNFSWKRLLANYLLSILEE